jgi:hypothetical protein
VEQVHLYSSIERARNAAIAWLQARGVEFGPHRKVELGRLESSILLGREVGVSASDGPYWRLRLDYDPDKGPHFNAEFGKGAAREKAAFTFPGTEDLIRKLANSRQPRR